MSRKQLYRIRPIKWIDVSSQRYGPSWYGSPKIGKGYTAWSRRHGEWWVQCGEKFLNKDPLRSLSGCKQVADEHYRRQLSKVLIEEEQPS